MTRAAPTPASLAKPVAPPQKLEHLTVLVVDDDRHMCSLIKTMLHQMGVKEIRLAMDAAEAFRELKVFSSDLIICDLRMLPLDGIEFTRLVRNAKDIRNRAVPIIMLTGHSDMGSVLEALEAGVSDFLAKPVSISRLRGRIERLFFRAKDEGPKGPELGPADPGALTQAEIEALLQN
jgi:PleD family two-component response regulator